MRGLPPPSLEADGSSSDAGVPTLLIDYGGVLTSPVPAAFANVCALFGVDLNGVHGRLPNG